MMQRTRAKRRAPERQSGAALVAALVCLLIVVSLVSSMLLVAVRARRQLHAERDRRQTVLLVQAGAQRAAYQLQRDPNYQGETWDLGDEALAKPGQVTIEVARDDESDPWQASVVAEYPPGSLHSIRRSRTFVISTENNQPQE